MSTVYIMHTPCRVCVGPLFENRHSCQWDYSQYIHVCSHTQEENVHTQTHRVMHMCTHSHTHIFSHAVTYTLTHTHTHTESRRDGRAHLSIICVDTRKDMRSPALSSPREMSQPPANMEPNTMPLRKMLAIPWKAPIPMPSLMLR